MNQDRIFWGAGAVILLLSVGLGAQVYSLFSQIEEKERTIRLLGAELRRRTGGAGPLQANLTEEGGRLFSLKIRLRAKNKEIEEMKDDLIQKEDEIESIRGESGKRESAFRSLRVEAEEAEKKMSLLLREKKNLEGRLVSVKNEITDRLKEKEKEALALRKDNEALKNSLDGLKQSVQVLERQNRKLAEPRLPEDAREKIKEFGFK